MYVYVRQERAQVCKYVDLRTVSMKLLERAKKSVEIDTAVNSLASGWFRGFPEKKNLNALDFAWNFSGPVCSTDLVKISKDASSPLLCTKKNFWGCGFFVSDVISGGLLGHLGPLCLALGTNR